MRNKIMASLDMSSPPCARLLMRSAARANIRLDEVEEQRASSKGTTGLELVIKLVPDLAASERSLRGYGGRGRE